MCAFRVYKTNSPCADQVFVLVLNLFYIGGPIVYFKENYYFPRFQGGGPAFFRGSNYYRGGVSIANSHGKHIGCDIPGDPDPPPPRSDSAHDTLLLVSVWLKLIFTKVL